VVQRILNEVQNPGVRKNLIDEVEEGGDLDNAEAGMVYPLDRERGSFFREFYLPAHAQYRMDLRSITVADVTRALNSFATQAQQWKAARDPRYETVLRQPRIEWLDPKTNLFVVFAQGRNGQPNLITTFWKGVPDPVPTEHCHLDKRARRVAERYVRRRQM
jgi:hypothetical protein